MKALLGRKLGMTQIFGEGDRLVPVTVIEAGPCYVTQVKTVEKDGYNAVQIGFAGRNEKHVNKPMRGHFTAAGVEPLRHVAEIRVDDAGQYSPGQQINVDVFTEGEKADVVGVTKGKGFTGVIKRWGFKGGPGGHGSHFHRAPGSIGMAATPSRVMKGKRLPGHHGNDRKTVQNLEIVKTDLEKNILLIKGALPGARGALVMVKQAKKAKTK